MSPSSTPARPLVSILLLTRNAQPWLARTLTQIAAQECDFAHELVAVDSGSCDGSVELLARAADCLLRVAPARFRHGATRNLGLEACRGELVVLLSQDAVPASRRWLGDLVAPLRRDLEVAASFARQIPHPGASAIARASVARWVAAGRVPRRVSLTPGEYARLTPSERYRHCALDNVCACVRREVWRAIPFEDVPIAEDVGWAKRVLLAGYAISFAPRSIVLHSHERSAWYELRRTSMTHRRLYELFGLRTIPHAWHLPRAITSTLLCHGRLAAAHLRGPSGLVELYRGLSLAVAWPLGQYLGPRALGRLLPTRGV